MMDLKLSPNARILYFLIDDKAGAGEMWWHWRKMALALGVGKARFFLLVKELRKAGLIFHRSENRRIFYSVSQSTKVDSSVHKSGPKARASINEPDQEPIPPLPPASGGTRCGCCLDIPRRILVSRDGRPHERMWCPECGGNRRSGKERRYA